MVLMTIISLRIRFIGDGRVWRCLMKPAGLRNFLNEEPKGTWIENSCNFCE